MQSIKLFGSTIPSLGLIEKTLFSIELDYHRKIAFAFPEFVILVIS